MTQLDMIGLKHLIMLITIFYCKNLNCTDVTMKPSSGSLLISVHARKNCDMSSLKHLIMLITIFYCKNLNCTDVTMKPSSGSLLISVHARKNCVYNKHYQILKQYYQVFHRDQSLDRYFLLSISMTYLYFLSNIEEVIYADDITLATICDDVKRIESNLFIDTKLL